MSDSPFDRPSFRRSDRPFNGPLMASTTLVHFALLLYVRGGRRTFLRKFADTKSQSLMECCERKASRLDHVLGSRSNSMQALAHGP